MSTAELTDQVVEFLTTGTRTGKIAWVSKDGRALVTPIWFIVEDGALVFNTGVDTSKGRALQRDSRATIVVDDEKPPFSFVQVQGTVSFDDDPDDLLRTATASPSGTWVPTLPSSSASAMPCPARRSCG